MTGFVCCALQIRAAHMCEAPYTGALNAQTRYTLDDGTQVVLDYPVKTYGCTLGINVVSGSSFGGPLAVGFSRPVAC